MAIRVYELSKKFEVSNKDVLKILNDNGFSIKSHISVVPEEAVVVVEKHFKKAKPEVAPETKSEAKKVEKINQIAQNKTEKEKPKNMHTQDLSQNKKPILNQNKLETKVENKLPEDKKINLGAITIVDIAQKANKSVSELILSLLKKGIVVTKNQILPDKIVYELASLCELEVVDKEKETKQSAISSSGSAEIKVEEKGNWQERLPIVVVVGHVDHGKTTLLDFIRKTRVAAKEKGGITQHLGAYEVFTNHGNLVFLDTPGHEAFSLIRARGIKVADIAILVVAADDGVMPQTAEAINLLKTSNITVVVALNKIDKATPAQIDIVKQQLSKKYDLTPEEWGGDTVFMPISAKFGTGIDQLLDVVVLQSQMLELKANLSVPATGYILESKFQKGLGPVGTVICLHGILKIGDYFVCGKASGRVTSLVNSFGERVSSVNPSIPVLVSGFDDLANSGDFFEVVQQKDIKRTLSKNDSRLDVMSKSATSESAINIIIKADNVSSKEALLNSISKLSVKLFKKINVVNASIGDITESDIVLAADTGSLIYSFGVKVQSNAATVLSKYKVKVLQFDIIYKLLEDLEARSESQRPIDMVTKKIGEASILKIFDIKNLGIIAGAVVRSGRFLKDSKVVIYRGKNKVGEGVIKGLQRDKKAVKEVHSGFECAFLVDGFDTWEVDDRVECFQEVPA